MTLFSDLWASQAGHCALCGEPMPENRWRTPHATVWKKRRPTFDHIRPRVKGGGDEAGNLQLVHAACNRIKGATWRP